MLKQTQRLFTAYKMKTKHFYYTNNTQDIAKPIEAKFTQTSSSNQFTGHTRKEQHVKDASEFQSTKSRVSEFYEKKRKRKRDQIMSREKQHFRKAKDREELF